MKVIITFISIAFLYSCGGQVDKTRVGEYFGEFAPKDSAKIFAVDEVSIQYNVRDFAVSPDGAEIFYSLRGPSGATIISLKRIDNIWSNPEVAPFSGEYFDLEPSFSPDGNKLYFVSQRPLEKGGYEKDFDIWYTEKNGTMWGEPVNLGEPVNTEANEFYPSFTSDGTLYFTAAYKESIGGEDIFFSKFQDGKFLQPENVGSSVNTEADEYNSFVSSDGSFLMFTSHGWGKGFGSGDLWVSFKDDNNEFQKPVNMGEFVNTPFFEFCPSLSPDGRYMFFTSNRRSEELKNKASTYNDIIAELQSPLNGSQNIYWIDAGFIKHLNEVE